MKKFEFYKNSELVPDFNGYFIFPIFLVAVTSYYEYKEIYFGLLIFKKQFVFVLRCNNKKVFKIKYLVFPGNVISKNDHAIHYIKAEELIDLYGVNSKDCKIINSYGDISRSKYYDHYIRLVPRSNGDYKEYLEHEQNIQLTNKINSGVIQGTEL